MTGTTTHISNADWIVAWNETAERHEYLRHCDLVFSGNTITFIGKGWGGKADTVVDGKGLCLVPGLVNIHSHPALEPFYRGVREEHGVPEMYMTGLYERGQAFPPDIETMPAAAEAAYCEMLLSGTTTVCDQMWPWPNWIDTIGRSGLRGFVAPGFASARWAVRRSDELSFNWNIEKGERDFAIALDLIDEAEAHSCGRLSGVILPLQIDTCTEELLRKAMAAAEKRNLPITTHISQSVVEFQEMVRRHGKTPIQWAHDIGLLGPLMTLGHAIFVDHHSWTNWWSRIDIDLLARTGTSVAHCPSPFARYGHVLEHFGGYVDAGVNMGLGTDVSPHNLIEEMRLAATLARITARDITSTSMTDVFHAATVGGAKALLRNDIGRLAAGCKADILLVEVEHPFMAPARDPLRSLIYTAADRAIRDVYIDGQMVVRDRKVLTLDHRDALARLGKAQADMLARTPQVDFAHRTAEQIAPLTLPMANQPTGA